MLHLKQKIRSGYRMMLMAMMLGVTGMASAYIPPVGEGWQERTYYNASGQAIGGVLYDCDGSELTWGTMVGFKTIKITNGPCP